MAVDAFERLAILLSAANAEPVIAAERAGASTLYDLDYRVAIVVSAFEIHAATDRFSPSLPRIQGRKLKLLQFAAMRPWLVEVIREWSVSRRDAQRSLESEASLRRGFMSDVTHDDVMEYVVAAGALRREEGFVLRGVRPEISKSLFGAAVSQRLFKGELAALEQLKGVVITNEMLEGW